MIVSYYVVVYMSSARDNPLVLYSILVSVGRRYTMATFQISDTDFAAWKAWLESPKEQQEFKESMFQAELIAAVQYIRREQSWREEQSQLPTMHQQLGPREGNWDKLFGYQRAVSEGLKQGLITEADLDPTSPMPDLAKRWANE